MQPLSPNWKGSMYFTLLYTSLLSQTYMPKNQKRSKVQHNPNQCQSPLNLISSIYHHEVIKSRHPRSHPPHSTHCLTYSSFRKIKHKKVTKGNDQEEWVVLYANIALSTLVRMQGHNWLD